MPILIINGSPRGLQGNTGILINACVDARKLVAAIQSKQPIADQVDYREQTFSMMRSMVTNKRDDWQYEYQYWKKHWGVEEE